MWCPQNRCEMFMTTWSDLCLCSDRSFVTLLAMAIRSDLQKGNQRCKKVKQLGQDHNVETGGAEDTESLIFQSCA